MDYVFVDQKAFDSRETYFQVADSEKLPMTLGYKKPFKKKTTDHNSPCLCLGPPSPPYKINIAI